MEARDTSSTPAKREAKLSCYGNAPEGLNGISQTLITYKAEHVLTPETSLLNFLSHVSVIDTNLPKRPNCQCKGSNHFNKHYSVASYLEKCFRNSYLRLLASNGKVGSWLSPDLIL